MAPLDIQIEGVSYIAGVNANGRWWVDLESVNVDQDIAVQQTEARFDVWISGTYDPATGAWAWPVTRPLAGQEVVMLNAAGTREFGGILLEVHEEEREPNKMVYHCQAGDYTKWFDRHLVNNTYAENTTVQELVQQVVDTYVNTVGNSRTFTYNNVQQSPSVPLPILQFVYLAPSQVMGQIVQMLGWGFFIDFYRDVNLFSTEYFTSPLPGNVLDADDIIENPDLAAEQLASWVDLQLGESVSQQKNRVFITGIYLAQNQLYQEQMQGDGLTTVFQMGYQPPNDISKITVSVNGTQYQVGLDLIDSTPGGPCEAQTAYINFTAQTIRFCAAPASGATITVTYYPMTQTVVMVENPSAQQFMAARDGTDGVYEYNRMDPSLSAELPSLAQMRAQMTLNKYAYPYKPSSFTSYISGWRVGQWFTFKSQRRMQGDYDGQQMFVIRVQKTIIQAQSDWVWKYEIDIANVPFSF